MQEIMVVSLLGGLHKSIVVIQEKRIVVLLATCKYIHCSQKCFVVLYSLYTVVKIVL